MITVAQAKAKLEEIRVRIGDSEDAHAREDELHRAVLKAIAKGSPDSQELAKIAVRTTRLKFSRWYS